MPPTIFQDPRQAFAQIDTSLRQRIESDDELAVNMAALSDDDLAEVRQRWNEKQRAQMRIESAPERTETTGGRRRRTRNVPAQTRPLYDEGTEGFLRQWGEGKTVSVFEKQKFDENFAQQSTTLQTDIAAFNKEVEELNRLIEQAGNNVSAKQAELLNNQQALMQGRSEELNQRVESLNNLAEATPIVFDWQEMDGQELEGATSLLLSAYPARSKEILGQAQDRAQAILKERGVLLPGEDEDTGRMIFNELTRRTSAAVGAMGLSPVVDIAQRMAANPLPLTIAGRGTVADVDRAPEATAERKRQAAEAMNRTTQLSEENRSLLRLAYDNDTAVTEMLGTGASWLAGANALFRRSFKALPKVQKMDPTGTYGQLTRSGAPRMVEAPFKINPISRRGLAEGAAYDVAVGAALGPEYAPSLIAQIFNLEPDRITTAIESGAIGAVMGTALRQLSNASVMRQARQMPQFKDVADASASEFKRVFKERMPDVFEDMRREYAQKAGAAAKAARARRETSSMGGEFVDDMPASVARTPEALPPGLTRAAAAVPETPTPVAPTPPVAPAAAPTPKADPLTKLRDDLELNGIGEFDGATYKITPNPNQSELEYLVQVTKNGQSSWKATGFGSIAEARQAALDHASKTPATPATPAASPDFIEAKFSETEQPLNKPEGDYRLISLSSDMTEGPFYWVRENITNKQFFQALEAQEVAELAKYQKQAQAAGMPSLAETQKVGTEYLAAIGKRAFEQGDLVSDAVQDLLGITLEEALSSPGGNNFSAAIAARMKLPQYADPYTQSVLGWVRDSLAGKKVEFPKPAPPAPSAKEANDLAKITRPTVKKAVANYRSRLGGSGKRLPQPIMLGKEGAFVALHPESVMAASLRQQGWQDVAPKGETAKPGLRPSFGSLPDGSEDLLTVIESLGGIRSPARSTGGEADGFASTFGRQPLRMLVHRDKGSRVDQLMEELQSLGYNFDSTDAFYAAADQAVQTRKALKEQMLAAENRDLFYRTALDNKGGRTNAQKPGPAEITPVDDLNVGDKFRIKGEPVVVKDIDPDDNTVLVDDGPRFGNDIELPAGAVVHPDKGSLKKIGVDTEFVPQAEAAAATLTPVEKELLRLTQLKKVEERAPGIFYVPEKTNLKRLSKLATEREQKGWGYPAGTNKVEFKEWTEVTGNPYDQGFAIIDRRAAVAEREAAATQKPFDLKRATPAELKAEAKRQADLATARTQAEEIARKQAAPLQGDSSDVGQGKLFAEDEDLFSGQSAQAGAELKTQADTSHAGKSPQELLSLAAPYEQTGLSYNRNIAAAAGRLRQALEKKLQSPQNFADELALRLDLVSGSPVQSAVKSAPEHRTASNPFTETMPRPAAETPDWIKSGGETRAGRRIIEGIERPGKKPKFSPRSIINFVNDTVHVEMRKSRSQTGKRHPAHYRPVGHIVYTRDANRADYAFHEAGHGLKELIEARDPGFFDRKPLADHLIALTQREGSMASAKNTHEGVAEWVRLRIKNPGAVESSPATPVLEAAMDQFVPGTAQAIRDAARAWERFQRLPAADRWRLVNRDLREANPMSLAHISNTLRKLAELVPNHLYSGAPLSGLDRKIFRAVVKGLRAQDKSLSESLKVARENRKARTNVILQAHNNFLRINSEVQNALMGTGPMAGLRVVGPDGNVQMVRNQTVRDLMRLVPGRQWADFQEGGWALTALTRWKKAGLEYPGQGDGFTPQDLATVVAQHRKEIANFDQAYKEIEAFMHDTVEVLRRAGVIGNDEALKIVNSYENYWPLPRHLQVSQMQGVGKSGAVGTGLRAARGSQEGIRDLIESIENRVRSIYDSVARHQLGRAIYEKGLEMANDPKLPKEAQALGARSMVRLKLKPEVVARVSREEVQKMVYEAVLEIKALESGMSVEMARTGFGPEDINIAWDFKDIFRPMPPRDELVVSLHGPNGREYFQVADPFMFQYFISGSPPGAVAKGLNWLTGPIRENWKRAKTQNIIFALLSNPVGDIANAMVLGDGPLSFLPGGQQALGLIHKFWRKYPQVFDQGLLLTRGEPTDIELINNLKHGPVWRFLVEGLYRSRHPDPRVRWASNILNPANVTYSIWKGTDVLNLLSGGRTIGPILESAAREGAAVQVKMRGGSDYEAWQAYWNVTGPFNEHAAQSDVRQIMQSPGFAKPMMNAFRRGLQKLFDPDPVEAAKTWLKLSEVGVLAGAGAVGTWMLMSDEERERERERPIEDRATHMNIHGMRVRMPYGFEGALHSLVWNSVLDHLLEVQPTKEDANRRAKLILQRIVSFEGGNPLYYLGPQIMAGAEASMNWNSYMQRHITSPWMAGLPPEMQYHATTPEFYRKLGQFFNYSPDKIQHIVRSGLDMQVDQTVRLLSQIENKRPIQEDADIPFVGRAFVRDPLGFGARSVQELVGVEQKIHLLDLRLKAKGWENIETWPASMVTPEIQALQMQIGYLRFIRAGANQLQRFSEMAKTFGELGNHVEERNMRRAMVEYSHQVLLHNREHVNKIEEALNMVNDLPKAPEERMKAEAIQRRLGR